MGQASHGRRTSSSSVLDSQVYDNYSFLKAIIIDIRSFVAYPPSTAYSGWGTGRSQEPFVHFSWTMHIARHSGGRYTGEHDQSMVLLDSTALGRRKRATKGVRRRGPRALY